MAGESPYKKQKQFSLQDSQDQEDFSQTDTPIPEFVFINEKPVDDVSLT